MDKKEQFFEMLFINADLKINICNILQINGQEFSQWVGELNKARAEEITVIKRVRSLYHNKAAKSNFSFANFNEFYKWFKEQYSKQKGKCYYCGTEEKVIASLCEKKYQYRKRSNRGNHLEVERRDAKGNLYNKENCVLACYFCNNDKSDIFSEDEYFQYLKNRKEFFEKEYQSIIK